LSAFAEAFGVVFALLLSARACTADVFRTMRKPP
jgi:hypothetical protein